MLWEDYSRSVKCFINWLLIDTWQAAEFLNKEHHFDSLQCLDLSHRKQCVCEP